MSSDVFTKRQENEGWPEQNTGRLENCWPPSAFPEDGLITIKLSEAEFTKLLSATTVGAVYKYPDEWIDLTSILLEGLHCNMAAKKSCCIVPQSVTQALINNNLGIGVEDVDDGQSGTVEINFNFPVATVLPDAVTDEILVDADPQGTGCDLDTLWASVDAFVEFVNQAIIDTLQQLEVFSNKIEIAGAILEAIPGIGSLPADDVAQIVNIWQEALLENYEAQITSGLLNELKCDLFAAVQPNCTVNVEDYVALLADKIGEQTFLSQLDAVFNFIAGGNFTSDTLVFATQWAWLQVARLRNILGIVATMRDLTNAIKVGALAPSKAHEILCDGSAWCHTWNFQVGLQQWLIDDDSVTVLDGVGLSGNTVEVERLCGVNPNEQFTGVSIRIPCADTATIVTAQINVDFQKGNHTVPANSGINYLTSRVAGATPANGCLTDDTLPNAEQSFGSMSDGNGQTFTHTLNANVDAGTSFYLQIRSSNNNTPPNGSVLLRSITLSGTGSDPFAGAPQC